MAGPRPRARWRTGRQQQQQPSQQQPPILLLFLLLLVLLPATATAATTAAFVLPPKPHKHLSRSRPSPLPSPLAAATTPTTSTTRPPPPTTSSSFLRLLVEARAREQQQPGGPASSGPRLRIRPLEKGDIPGVEALAAREFTTATLALFDEFVAAGDDGGGSGGGLSTISSPGLMERLDAWWLRLNVRWAFRLRLAYPDKEDHLVFVLLQDNDSDEGKNATPSPPPFAASCPPVLGIVELSKQPTTGWPTPLLPYPPQLKQAIAALLRCPVRPYLSNLLIDASLRRQGYGRRMVEHCEGVCKARGDPALLLHADAGYGPANRLYEAMGYRALKEDPQWVEWLGMTRLKYYRKDLPPA